MLNKIFYTVLIFLIIFYFGMVILMGAGSFFTVISEKSYIEKPLHYAPKSEMTYEAYLMGIFPIVVETAEEIDCKVMIIEGDLAKIKKTDGDEIYTGYHLLNKKHSCFQIYL